MVLGHIDAYVNCFLFHTYLLCRALARPCKMRARSAQATVRAPLGKGAATLTISRSLMTKKRSVYRTSLHLGKVIVQTRINIQEAWRQVP